MESFEVLPWKPEPSTPYFHVGDGLLMQEFVSVPIAWGGVIVDLHLRLAESGTAGEPDIVVDEMTLRPRAPRMPLHSGHASPPEQVITSDLLRKLPLAQMRRAAMESATYAVTGPGRSPATLKAARVSELAREGRDAATRSLAGKTGQRRRITDELLREVAETYRNANEDPTKAVERAFYTSHSTAARWVGKARRRGLLGPTKPGRPGEISETHGDED